MPDMVKLALAQVDFVVGDVEGNTGKILDKCRYACSEMQADLVVFPELSICGYPPEDLLFHSGMRSRIAQAVETIRTTVNDTAVMFGYPEYDGDCIYNSAVIFKKGEILAKYRKCLLPNYRVFDEKRYFASGKSPTVFKLNGRVILRPPVGLLALRQLLLSMALPMNLRVRRKESMLSEGVYKKSEFRQFI